MMPSTRSGGSSSRSPAAQIFGERVRAQRTILGVSQEALGERAGMHWTFIGQVERGQRNVTLHNLVKIAQALDIDPGELVKGLKGSHLTDQLLAKKPPAEKSTVAKPPATT